MGLYFQLNPGFLQDLGTNTGLVSLLVLLHGVMAPLQRRSRVAWELGIAVLYGVSAVLAMQAPLVVAPGVVVDAKTVILALAGAFLPWRSVLLALIIAGAYRAGVVGGVGTPVGIGVMISVAAWGMAVQRWSGGRSSELRWLVALGFGVSILAMLWTLLLPAGVRERLFFALWVPVPIVFTVSTLVFGRLLGTIEERARALAELRDANDELSLREELLQLSMEASGDGLWRRRGTSEQLDVSESFFRQLGHEPGEFVPTARATAALVHPDDAAQLDGSLDMPSDRAGAPFSHELRRRVKGGAYRWFLSRGKIVQLSNGERMTIGVLTDIHEAKSRAQTLEAEVLARTGDLEVAMADLARARDAAEAADRAKSEFLANMSHEIRTPMNAVIGMTDLVLREDISTKVRGYVTKVRIAARNLLGIINDILDFSKIEAGMLHIDHVEFELQDVFDRVMTVVGFKAQQKGIELLVDMAAHVPERFVGDPLRLEQVLVNLCMNAVKFTEQGEITLVTTRSSTADQLEFTVTDTGIGMSPEQVATLFQPFNQLEPSTTRRQGGTGLGLAISRQLVELMGGTIGVLSEPGAGSAFSFSIQLASPPHADGETSRPSYPLDGLRILVIDGSAAARTIFASQLSRLGARVDLAPDTGAGWAKVVASPGDIDVALVDLKLLDEDGLSLIHRMQERTGIACRFVLTAAFGDDAAARRAADANLAGCLVKPFSRRSLVQAIARPSTNTAVVEATGSDVLAQAPLTLRGRRVLLVEDNEFNQIVAMELLGSVAGMQVQLAHDGLQALQLLQSGTFDVVLMDVQMPGMDGFEVTRRVRLRSEFAELPIIAMTAFAMQSDRARCLQAGMNDFVTKPVEPAELFAVLTRWLSPARPDHGADSPPGKDDQAGSVSMADGLRRCMGRQELYERIVKRFVATRSGDAAQMHAALASGDRDTIGRIAHVVVSNGGTIGANALSTLAEQIQTAVDERLPDAALARLVNAFQAEHAEVLRELGG